MHSRLFHFRLFAGILSGVVWLATHAFHSSSDDGSLQTKGCVSWKVMYMRPDRYRWHSMPTSTGMFFSGTPLR